MEYGADGGRLDEPNGGYVILESRRGGDGTAEASRCALVDRRAANAPGSSWRRRATGL